MLVKCSGFTLRSLRDRGGFTRADSVGNVALLATYALFWWSINDRPIDLGQWHYLDNPLWIAMRESCGVRRWMVDLTAHSTIHINDRTNQRVSTRTEKWLLEYSRATYYQGVGAAFRAVSMTYVQYARHWLFVSGAELLEISDLPWKFSWRS